MSARVEARRRRTKDEIVAAAWRVAEREGLAAFTLRDLAVEVGMRAPSLYGYFDGKAAIYDGMFVDGFTALDETLVAAIDPTDEPRARLLAGVEAWLAFCQASLPRYQLMFTRVLVGWEPAPDAYAASETSFARMRTWLVEAGVATDEDVDLVTAVVSGLAAQQTANEPGGRRWNRLAPRAIQMLLTDIDRKDRP